MKKVISLMSLLCLSASIMGMDMSNLLQVQVSSDKTNQLPFRKKIPLEYVKSSDNMKTLAEKISQAAAKMDGVNKPVKVERMLLMGQDMLTNENKYKTVESSGMLQEGPVFVVLDSVSVD